MRTAILIAKVRYNSLLRLKSKKSSRMVQDEAHSAIGYLSESEFKLEVRLELVFNLSICLLSLKLSSSSYIANQRIKEYLGEN